jgi:hypothetical protein
LWHWWEPIALSRCLFVSFWRGAYLLPNPNAFTVNPLISLRGTKVIFAPTPSESGFVSILLTLFIWAIHAIHPTPQRSSGGGAMCTNKVITELGNWAHLVCNGKGELADQHLHAFYHLGASLVASKEFQATA